jgi:hypothetical protein
MQLMSVTYKVTEDTRIAISNSKKNTFVYLSMTVANDEGKPTTDFPV